MISYMSSALSLRNHIVLGGLSLVLCSCNFTREASSGIFPWQNGEFIDATLSVDGHSSSESAVSGLAAFWTWGQTVRRSQAAQSDRGHLLIIFWFYKFVKIGSSLICTSPPHKWDMTGKGKSGLNWDDCTDMTLHLNEAYPCSKLVSEEYSCTLPVD